MAQNFHETPTKALRDQGHVGASVSHGVPVYSQLMLVPIYTAR